MSERKIIVRMSDTAGFVLPPRPQKPDDEDCCKNDCEMCVFSVYEKQILEWEKLCSEIKKQKYRACLNLPSVLSQIKYMPFQLVDVTPLTSDTQIYRFQACEDKMCDIKKECTMSLNIDIGQHLILKNGSNHDSLITRSYTPISDMDSHSQGCFDVLIKVYPGGKMSDYIKTWRIGETVYWRGPFGTLSYAKNKFKHVIMCCCGTGIAPMIRLIKSIIEDEEEETFVYLLYSCKKYEEVLLCDEISNFRSFWNFSSYLFITQEIPQHIRYGENVIQSRITLDFLKKKFVEMPLERILVLICGTDSFNEDIKKIMNEIGILEESFHVF